MSSLDHTPARTLAGPRPFDLASATVGARDGVTAGSTVRSDASRLRRRGHVSAQLLMLLLTTLVGVPAIALGTIHPQWFQQWSGGAPLMMSGESIGSLPCYLTPDTTAPVPGATAEENGLQLLPAIEVDVPFNTVYDTVVDAHGNGYAFLGPGSGNSIAEVRFFGDVSIDVDPTFLEGRDRTVYWNVGPAFAGATLHYALGSLASFGSVSQVSGKLELPVDSPAWQAAFAKGVISLALVRADGAVAVMHLDEMNGAIVAFQSVP